MSNYMFHVEHLARCLKITGVFHVEHSFIVRYLFYNVPRGTIHCGTLLSKFLESSPEAVLAPHRSSTR